MPERFYSLLLRLYPRAFRQRYADEMVRVFCDRLRHESAARVWIDVLGDAVASIPRQHWRREPHPIYPSSAAPLRAAYTTVMQAMLVSAILGGFLGVGLMMTAYLGITAVMTRFPGGLLAVGLIFLVWLSAFRKARRTSQTLKTFRYDAGGDSVTVAYDGMAPLTLQRSEVTGLHDFEKVGLRIQTADPARDLWVPVTAASYPSVKARVSEWAPVTVTPLRLVPVDGGFLQLSLLYALGLFIPMTFAAGIAGALLLNAIWAMAKRDLPARKTLLYLGPVAILLVRWLW